jgi:hypothetical protein
VERYLSRGPRAIHIANRRENAGGNDIAIFSGMKKMTSEIALCRDHWKYRSKISLPHIAHLRCRKSRSIAIGIL